MLNSNGKTLTITFCVETVPTGQYVGRTQSTIIRKI